MEKREFNTRYTGTHLRKVAFPLGGMGAGMFCLEGTGAVSHMSVRHRPDVFFEPVMFAALHLKGIANGARVLEGPVPEWKYFGPARTANGGHGAAYGLPRFENAAFDARFPFCSVDLSDSRLPITVTLTGYSPFIPGNSDDSSLPYAALDYTIKNPSDTLQEGVFSYHAQNFMGKDMTDEQRRVTSTENGFILETDAVEEKPWLQGAFALSSSDPDTQVDHRWFRGGWFDPLTVIWKNITQGTVISNEPFDKEDAQPSPGGSLYIPFKLEAGAEKTIQVQAAWYVPLSDIRVGKEPEEESCGSGCRCGASTAKETYKPWYSGRFASIEDILTYTKQEQNRLRAESAQFRDTFFDTTLPPAAVEAIAANLSILKSPTVLRQTDGRMWAWEGCCDCSGCCAGSCTHVWNYAQAVAHLFPDLERSLRRTEFYECQDEKGHQYFRAPLPIREGQHEFHAAADGQLGGIIKAYREWRISGDADWLKEFWPLIKQSLEYCIITWDPDENGTLVEPHHNTYDIEFWGPNGMCTSFYCGALKAAGLMAEYLEDQDAVTRYNDLYQKSKTALEDDLFDGEYFIQKIQWKGLRTSDPTAIAAVSKIGYSAEARELLEKEGPKYQYGTGCLSDGVLGAWIAECAGISAIMDQAKVTSHLKAVHKHNLKTDLSLHANPQRPTYALGKEGGLLLCSWPKGGELTLPFVYSDEVWTGIEYQAASHLIMAGELNKGLDIVKEARLRYDGTKRNPFNEYECGHWYARALASYGLLQSYSGARYDAVDKVLYLEPRLDGDFRSFLCTAGGYGTVGIKDGKPFCEVISGSIPYERIEYAGR